MIIGVLILGWMACGYLSLMVAKRGEYVRRWGFDWFNVVLALFGPIALLAQIATSGFKFNDRWIL
jgi:hypothetical protein